MSLLKKKQATDGNSKGYSFIYFYIWVGHLNVSQVTT